MKKVKIFIFSIVFLWTVCSIANSADLIFYDDFDRAEIGSNWTTGAGGGIDTISIVDGRIQSTDNGNYIESVQEFSGNFRIEIDVEKIGVRDHTCWDFRIELGGTNAGAIRFDWESVDGIKIFTPTNNDCIYNAVTEGESPNKGKAIYTFKDGSVDFVFINENLDVLYTESEYRENFGPGKLKISLAAYADSPRYIDNVKVYSLPTFSISDLNKDGDVDGADLGKFAEDFGLNATE